MDATTAQKLNDKIQEKMKETFIDLVPEDEWEALIQSAINKFIAHRPAGDKLTPLETEVHAMLRENLREKVRAKISELANGWWDGTGEVQISNELEDLLKKAAPSMLTSIMASVAQNVFSNAQSGSIY